MKILNQETVTVPLKTLKPHPENPRKGNVAGIAESIAVTGFYGTIIVQQSTGYVLAGNHRLQAAKKAGAKEVPVTYVDVDDAGAKRILLGDNRLNDVAEYDDKLLADVLQGILNEEGTLEGTGYNDDDLAEILLRAEGEEDFSGESEIEHEDKPARNVIIQYNIVFDTEQQQDTWFAFVKLLKERYPTCETLGERLEVYLGETEGLGG